VCWSSTSGGLSSRKGSSAKACSVRAKRPRFESRPELTERPRLRHIQPVFGTGAKWCHDALGSLRVRNSDEALRYLLHCRSGPLGCVRRVHRHHIAEAHARGHGDHAVLALRATSVASASLTTWSLTEPMTARSTAPSPLEPRITMSARVLSASASRR
jgi:hypothetical protein